MTKTRTHFNLALAPTEREMLEILAKQQCETQTHILRQALRNYYFATYKMEAEK